MKRGMTIEYLMCRAINLNFEVDFGVNGAIGTIVTKWDLSVLGKCIVFIHNNFSFKYAAFPFKLEGQHCLICNYTYYRGAG